jgi:hypothetical protein
MIFKNFPSRNDLTTIIVASSIGRTLELTGARRKPHKSNRREGDKSILSEHSVE